MVDENKAEEITKDKAVYHISRNYVPLTAETMLETSTKEKPIRTSFAYYWKS
jgi:hypothetical protein